MSNVDRFGFCVENVLCIWFSLICTDACACVDDLVLISLSTCDFCCFWWVGDFGCL